MSQSSFKRLTLFLACSKNPLKRLVHRESHILLRTMKGKVFPKNKMRNDSKKGEEVIFRNITVIGRVILFNHDKTRETSSNVVAECFWRIESSLLSPLRRSQGGRFLASF